jgi:D-threo-aldose 1-dehydrogenase
MIARRRLGRTTIEISELGFGGAPLGDLYTHLDDGQAIAAVRSALEAGIAYVSTAMAYPNIASARRSEALIVRRWCSPPRSGAG